MPSVKLQHAAIYPRPWCAAAPLSWAAEVNLLCFKTSLRPIVFTQACLVLTSQSWRRCVALRVGGASKVPPNSRALFQSGPSGATSLRGRRFGAKQLIPARKTLFPVPFRPSQTQTRNANTQHARCMETTRGLPTLFRLPGSQAAASIFTISKQCIIFSQEWNWSQLLVQSSRPGSGLTPDRSSRGASVFSAKSGPWLAFCLLTYV